MLIANFFIGFLEIKWVDVIDIVLVSGLLFSLYRLVKGTIALRVLTGFLVLYFIFLLVQATRMELLTLILDKFMGVAVFAAIILFQQEIRKFLIIIGRSTELNGFTNNLLRVFKKGGKEAESPVDINAIIEAMKSLGASNTGALMVLSRGRNELENYAETGDLLDAKISKRLLLAIFNKNSPLHDGAVLISQGRIKAARCIMPVSDNRSIPATMGLRHRAAIGVSEVTDTVVLVVSEETGQLSVVRSGTIFPNQSPAEIRHRVNEFFMPTEEHRQIVASMANTAGHQLQKS
jgi:uncharacterized protein (TIGR00159 family)